MPGAATNEDDDDDEEDWDAAIVRRAEAEGRAQGRLAGFDNGVRHGREAAHDTCYELGYAQGVAEACQALLPVNSKTAAGAVQDAVRKTKWSSSSSSSPPSESSMQQVRARFRVLDARAGLGMRQQAESSFHDMSF